LNFETAALHTVPHIIPITESINLRIQEKKGETRFINVILFLLLRWPGIAQSIYVKTRYVFDGPEIEPRWGRDFTHPSEPTTLGPPAYGTIFTGSFPGVKRAKRDVDHPPTSNDQVKGNV